ncbi:LOG family protein [Candidatus Peregrinibacteria bacterium]|nr:LOG family protein [Candidatus Peregrinibacteria bacterium]
MKIKIEELVPGHRKVKVHPLDLKKELRRKRRFRVSIFGSARVKRGDRVYKQVFDLAEMIGKKGYDVVTGGGPGLMEAANAGHALGDKENSAESIGLVIKLPWENKGNDYLEIQHRYKYFSKRLDTFLALSDVMVVTKGGIGSMLELFYMWQHLQVFLVEYKPIILIGKMWEELIDWVKKTTLPERLVSPEDFDFIYIAKNNKEAMAMIEKFRNLELKEGQLRRILCKGAHCVIPAKKKKA